jgi:hypothetical protein
MNLASVAEEIQHRIIHIFRRDTEGRRATNGRNSKLDYDPHFRDYVWFYEVRIHQLLVIFIHGSDPTQPCVLVLPRRYWKGTGCLPPDGMASNIL